MQPNTSAAVSGGVATSAMIVIAWLFTLAHIAIPDSVQVALASLMTAGLGYFFHTRGLAMAAAAAAVADKARTAAEAAAGTVAVLLVLFAVGGLSACSEYQAGFTAIQQQSIKAVQNVNDDAASTWAATGCGLTWGAAVRNPAVGRVLPFLCGKLSDGSELAPASQAPTPAAAPVQPVSVAPAS